MTAERQGTDMLFTCTCRQLPEGLYRLSVCGERRLLLGSAESSGGSLRMSRRYSSQLTGALGALRRGELTEVSAPAWKRVDGHACPDWPADTLVRRDGDGMCFAVPYDAGKPFTMPRYFCFARVVRIGAGEYALFRFDHAGQPQ